MPIEELLTRRITGIQPFNELPIDAEIWREAHGQHIQHRLLHDSAVHRSGIVYGLDVFVVKGAKKPTIAVAPGIAIDPDGVPHIKALSELDAAAALGYVHARDRMFQMELMRRSASGRIAEIAGRPGVPLDRAMRTYGIARLARDDWAALPNEAKELLEAYARGVNAWIAERGRFAAPEFVALGAPEPWTTTDSMLWPRSMGLVLARNWRSEIARMHLSQQLSPAKIDDLWPSGTPRQHAENDRSSDLLQFAATDLWQASNEWAVDGKRSTTGAPLLAGDPHLGFAFPGLWYLARIDTPTGALAGATAPGMPQPRA